MILLLTTNGALVWKALCFIIGTVIVVKLIQGFKKKPQ